MDLLAEHTTTTLADRIDDASVALLPAGAIEQHGPALPLGTDLFAAEAIADGVDSEDVLVLPPVPIGVSDHHRQFHGTLWTDPATLAAYVGDVAESLASHGLRKVVVVNGHGGNDDALERVARNLRDRETAFVVPWNWWSNLHHLLASLFQARAIGHADAVETSLLLAVRPDLVREDALEAAETGASEQWGREVAGANVGFDAAEFSDSGAVGEPTAASAEAGEKLYDQAVADLEALIDWLADRDFSDLLPPGHR
jgi:creatinine amidohydrolase